MKRIVNRGLAVLLTVMMLTGLIPMNMSISAEENGGWRIQDWGGSEDITVEGGWITPAEEGNGFTLDYSKIISDRGKEGLVIYDSNAKKMLNSTLELDVTLTKGTSEDADSQSNFYSFGVFPIFKDGANCEGINIHDKGRLEHSRQNNGSESHNWIRGDEGDFVFGETYHLKLVTMYGNVTLYAAKKGEELQEKTSFKCDSDLGATGYGFRVWRGAKTIKVENIVRTEISSSYLVNKEAEISDSEWMSATIEIPVVLKEGDSVEKINDGTMDLTPGSHYSVLDNTITISPDYMKTQGTNNEINLTVSFAQGDTDSFKIIRITEGDGGWKMYRHNSSEATETQPGWITVSDGGSKVVIDYGRAVDESGSEGFIVLNKEAPEYQNSMLEYDITFTEGVQAPFVAVAPVTRGVDGGNYEGFAITQGTGLERTGRLNGSESYAGIDNKLGVSFEYDKTYHIRMETIDNHITVYLTRDGKEEKLTEFDSPIGLDKGTYGFRIWRGGKTITIENIKRTEIITSKFDRSTVNVDKETWGQEDITANISFGTGDSIKAIKNGDAVLENGKDYTIEGNVFTLKKEYIAAQSGNFRLQAEFAMGSVASLWIMKYDPDSPQEYTWTPDQGIDMWKSIDGNGSFELTEDGTAMRVKGTTALMNELAPLVANGEIEITFEALRDLDGYDAGGMFRADDVTGDWQALASTDTIAGEAVWDFINNGSKNRYIWDAVQNMSRDGVMDIKVKMRYVDDSITLWVDDQFAHTAQVSQAETTVGGMGLYVDNNGDILVKKVVFREVVPYQEAEGEREPVTIENDGLSVRLDSDFPHVIDYTLNGKVMNGAELRYNYVTINTVDYKATAEITEQTENSITYHVTPDGIDVPFDVVFTVKEDQMVEMLIKNIDESNVTVNSIGFPVQPLISANSAQADASLDAAWVEENNRKILDLSENIADKKVSTYAPRSVNTPFISADGLSASMFNNCYLGGEEFAYIGFELPNGEESVGVWNQDFMYRGVDGEKILPFASEPDENDLYCRIVITEDNNGDGIANWQDGANALQTLVSDLIPGGDDAARSFFHVGYNFASGAQQPFLKVADNLKRLSNYIDGFSQQLVFKGYANEGHDSGHAEYSDINSRAGGAEDFATAIAEADKINSNIGIHINVQESYPEAEMFDKHVTGDKDGWRWMDQSKIIRRYVYMLEGGFEEELDSLYEQVPDLDFVYVDCWGEDRWGEKKLIGTLLENGCEMFGNENAPDFMRFGAWVHSNVNNSQIHQFTYNSQKDIYPNSSVYWGGYSRRDSMMSWQHNNNINALVQQFYTNQLPQKYLMCHDVERVADGVGYFSDNVTSGNYTITKDGKKLTDGNGKIFIPWYDEDTSVDRNPDEAAKIYHWNSNGGKTTWDLPDSWSDVTTVYLYRTTQDGKTDETPIKVENGQVTIDAKAKTPYVLYKEPQEADVTEWSVGSPLKDTGFNSRDFSIWQNSGDAEIYYEDDGNGVSILNIKGSEEGQVSQTMEGLVPGQKYRVVVHAGAENGKTARLTVDTGTNTYENYLEKVGMTNQYFDSYVKGKNMQRMWVDFVAESDTATVTLSGDACESADGKTTFMETRIVKTAEPDLPEGYVANETFEYVEQGAYGIFNPERSADGVPHLSETHRPYTNDTIKGDWSLKLYGHYGQGDVTVRTSPATMRLEPNTTYTVEFDTLGNGKVYIQSEADGNDKVLEESYSAGHHKYTFTTGDKNDYIARIERSSVLDNFKVYLTDEVTEVTGIDIENKEIEMSVGDTLTLNPTIQPVEANNKQVVWNTDENDIVSVDQTGKLVAVAKGTTTITGTTVEGGYSVTVTVTVTDKEYAKGDVNHDGVLNIDDATLIQQFLVELNPDNFDQTLADMNDDGVINIIDATLIQLAIKA